MKSPEQRKQASIELLKKQEIPYIDWLPTLPDATSVRIRSAEEIARRAIACLIAIQAACDRDKNEYSPEAAQYYMALLQRYELEQCLTPNEIRILNNQGAEIDVINMAWKYEAYWILLWALGIVENLDFPDHIIDCDFAIQAVLKHESFAAFMQTVKLRDIEEILDSADLIYRYHWACRDALLNKRKEPKGMINSIVLERHRGFNWLIDIDDSDNWDNPDCST